MPAGGGTFAGANANAFAASTLATNSWTYLATTYDGANLRLYVNGTLAATQAKTGAITSSTNPLTIGSDPIWGQYFNGLIDDVRIYNTALTASPDPNRHDHPDRKPTFRARDANGDGNQQQRDRPHVGSSDRQPPDHRLPGRALPRRQLQQLHPDRDTERNHLQRYGTHGEHNLQLPGSRCGRGRCRTVLQQRQPPSPG